MVAACSDLPYDRLAIWTQIARVATSRQGCSFYLDSMQHCQQDSKGTTTIMHDSVKQGAAASAAQSKNMPGLEPAEKHHAPDKVYCRFWCYNKKPISVVQERMKGGWWLIIQGIENELLGLYLSHCRAHPLRLSNSFCKFYPHSLPPIFLNYSPSRKEFPTCNSLVWEGRRLSVYVRPAVFAPPSEMHFCLLEWMNVVRRK